MRKIIVLGTFGALTVACANNDRPTTLPEEYEMQEEYEPVGEDMQDVDEMDEGDMEERAEEYGDQMEERGEEMEEAGEEID